MCILYVTAVFDLLVAINMSGLNFRTMRFLSQCCHRYLAQSRTSSMGLVHMGTKTYHSTILMMCHPKAKTESLNVNYSYVRNLSSTNKDSNESQPPQTVMEKFVDKMPLELQPYLKLIRLHKPTGTLLLLWPCYWSLALAAPAGSLPDPTFLAMFGCGAVLMRGAGCTINDLWDKDIDSKVSRTKSRPLASGQLSTLDAWMFLGGQLSLALLILLKFNWYSIVLGSSSLFLVILYPLVKRVWNWPQLVLGLTFNWGALLGWSAVHGSCYWPVVLPLYGACISWTLIYDTIYAHQDKVDDVLVKIKSTALVFAEKTKVWLSCFAVTATTCFIGCGYAANQTWPYYLSVAVASSMFASQISTLNIDCPKDCWEKFKSNQRIGWLIFAGIIGGTLLKPSEKSQVKQTNRLSKENFIETPALQLT